MRIILLLIAASRLFGQSPASGAPQFTREGIIPFQATRPRLLAPGMVVTIYVTHLEPGTCAGPIEQQGPYPLEACGVRVMVAGSPARLMFVGTKQINTILPEDAPVDGTAPIQICVHDRCSAPVEMRFSTHKAFLQVEGAAYVHMPIWIQVEQPMRHELGYYPCQVWPWDFMGGQFEVRRNGQPLSPLAEAARLGGDIGVNGCVGMAERDHTRLPVHLKYRFDQPGTYSLRFTAYSPRFRWTEISSQSDWTDIVVQPFSSGQRNSWLRSMEQKAGTASPEELFRDVLPSLLAVPDDQAAAIVVRFLDHRNNLVRQFARNSLAAFDDDVLRRAIPVNRLMELCPPQGRCRTPVSQTSDHLIPPTGVFRDSGTSPPVLLYKVDPEYSDEARKAKYQGTVLLAVQIDPDGNVTFVRVVHAIGLGLDEKALEAVRKWKFRPYSPGARPMAMEFTIEVNFRL